MSKIKPCFPHLLFIGKQRCGKDLLILHDVFHIIKYGKSIFHPYLQKENLDFYETSSKIFANCNLDTNVFSDFYRIKTIEDIEKASGPALLWIHDADLWFNSRNIFMTNKKDNSKLLHLVNNMGKLGLSARISCHRRNSLDVKLRQLMNLKILPKMVCRSKDRTDFTEWEIHFKVFDEWDMFLGKGRITDIHKIADYYNTEEVVEELQ